MPLTRDFRETVKARVERDPEFRAALLRGNRRHRADRQPLGDAAGP